MKGNYFNLSDKDLTYLRANIDKDPELKQVWDLYCLYSKSQEPGSFGLLEAAVREWERKRAHAHSTR